MVQIRDGFHDGKSQASGILMFSRTVETPEDPLRIQRLCGAGVLNTNATGFDMDL